MAMKRVLEHRGSSFSKAGDLSLYVVEETALQTFESPATSDLILAISVEGDDQAPERLVSEARQNGDRMPKGTFAGRIDHGEKTLSFEVRPPGALGGTDVPMGDAVYKALMGSKRIVNSQSAIAIDSVQSHSRTSTVVRITASVGDFQLGDIVALRSNNAETAHMDHYPACVVLVADPGGGDIDITLKPGLPSEPFIGGTPDDIQGGVTYKPQNDFAATFSGLWNQGFSGELAEGGVVPSGTFNFDGRSILTQEFAFHYKRGYYSGVGFVSGTAGTDAFLTTTLPLDVDDASLYAVGSFVNLLKYTPSTGALSATEVKAEVTARNTTASPNTLTLTRGTSPVAQTGGTHDLTVTTLTTTHQETLTTLNIIAGDFIRIELDHRGYIDVPLTVNAAATATDIVADINAALQYSEKYGQAIDAPYVDADWATAASVAPANEVNLLSQSFGAQSQFKATLTGIAGDRFVDIWVPAATFEIVADGDIQIVPWPPGGTVTTTPIVNKDNFCLVNGYKLLIASGAVTIDNQVEHIEDVKTGGDYETGHLSGLERLTQAAISLPAFGWTARIRKMSEDDDSLVLGFVTGATLGGTFSIFFTKAKTSGQSKSGDNRQDSSFTVTAEDPGVTVTLGGTTYVLKECYIGIT